MNLSEVDYRSNVEAERPDTLKFTSERVTIVAEDQKCVTIDQFARHPKGEQFLRLFKRSRGCDKWNGHELTFHTLFHDTHLANEALSFFLHIAQFTPECTREDLIGRLRNCLNQNYHPQMPQAQSSIPEYLEHQTAAAKIVIDSDDAD